MKIRGQYLFVNQTLTPLPYLSDLSNPGETSIYEVIRIIDSVPLFLEEHFLRLKNSAALLHIKLSFSLADIAQQIQTLAQENGIFDGNVKLIFPESTSAKNGKSHTLLFFIPHHYPTPQEYQKGYKLKSVILERPQPNAKSIKGSFSQHLSQLKNQENIDEILLIRNDGILTEGSKSNIFFIKQNQLFTAPKNMVLPGITRQKIIELCQNHTIPCHESEIKLSELKNMEAAFITGTSPKVMPVNKVDDIDMQVNHPLIETVMELYSALLEKEIKSFRIENA